MNLGLLDYPGGGVHLDRCLVISIRHQEDRKKRTHSSRHYIVCETSAEQPTTTDGFHSANSMRPHNTRIHNDFRSSHPPPYGLESRGPKEWEIDQHGSSSLEGATAQISLEIERHCALDDASLRLLSCQWSASRSDS